MADVERCFLQEIRALHLERAPIGPQMFCAERLHLYTFETEDWIGAWWETLNWNYWTAGRWAE